MISITVGTNTARRKIVVDPNTTLRKVLTDNGVNPGLGTIFVNATPFAREDLDKTLAELNIGNDAMVLSIAKADNA